MLLMAKDLSALFIAFIRCEFSRFFRDHAHTKLINNLANSVTTIIGNSHREESALRSLQAVLTQLTNEGINTLEAAGIKETKAGPLPPWNVIRLIKRLPAVLTRFIFKRKIAIVGSTSMAMTLSRTEPVSRSWTWSMATCWSLPIHMVWTCPTVEGCISFASNDLARNLFGLCRQMNWESF